MLKIAAKFLFQKIFLKIFLSVARWYAEYCVFYGVCIRGKLLELLRFSWILMLASTCCLSTDGDEIFRGPKFYNGVYALFSLSYVSLDLTKTKKCWKLWRNFCSKKFLKIVLSVAGWYAEYYVFYGVSIRAKLVELLRFSWILMPPSACYLSTDGDEIFRGPEFYNGADVVFSLSYLSLDC